MVQQELHPSDERREGHGDSGEPLANETAAGIPETLTPQYQESEAQPELPYAEPTYAASEYAASEYAAAESGDAVSSDGSSYTEPPPADGFNRGAMETPAFGPLEPRFIPATEPARELRLDPQPDATALMFQRINVWKDELIAWFKTLASAAVYATLIVTFGFQVARVEGLSMAPTLEDQDRLIVNKLAYRLGPPRRGDIVMLYYPLNPDKSFVKRVIAEEGDQVRIVDGRVYVNDVPMADDFVPPEYRSHDDVGPIIVREGYYYVMGDHRNNSSDSRHWGEVPKKYIIGKVQLRWWPIPTARVF